MLLSQASDALKALLKTANEPVETQDTITNEVEEKLPEEAEAAVLEMEEDNRRVTPAPAPRGRTRGDRRRVRVNIRGRGQQRVQANKEDRDEVEAPRQTVSRDRFRSFPARQSSGRKIESRPAGTRSRIVTPRTPVKAVELETEAAPVTEAATRFETRPTAAPVTTTTARQLNFQVFDNFEGFTFPAPIRAPPTTESTPLATELPRSQFTLQQNFVPQQPAVQTVQQPRPAAQPVQQPRPTVQAVQQPQLAVQPVQQPRPVVQTVQQQRPAVAQPQQPQRIQPFVAFNSQQIQPFTQQQQVVTQAPVAQTRINPAPATQAPAIPLPSNQQFLNNPSFNLLNPTNFQAFDAQFGGSVPSTNTNANQSPSSIFTQPQTSLLQGRDVIVNPFTNQQTVFGQNNLFGQQQVSTNNFQAFRSG